MAIMYDATRRAFHIQVGGMSYAMVVDCKGKLMNAYWGGRLPSLDCLDGILKKIDVDRVRHHAGSMTNNLEFRDQDAFDYAEPAVLAIHGDGVRSTMLYYDRHQLDGNKLSIVLKDKVYPFEVELVYETFGELELLSRRAIYRNVGEESVTLDIMKSATVSLPARQKYRITHFSGNWGAEYGRQTLDLTQGQFVLESHRLVSAAQQHTPFIMLDPRGESTETSGEVYFGALQWSGDFKITVEKVYFGDVTVTAGVSDYDCQISLGQGESFEAPAFCIGYSGCGFERMSEILYDWQFDHISPRSKAYTIRPIIYNSWYPYLFDIYEENLLNVIVKAKEVGAELFVIDDGWMPKRVNSEAGLGDWVPDKERFPNGFTPIVEACHANGLLFGLWVEPEMCNPDSDIYRAHPEWILSEPTREPALQRTQYVLDISREDVCQWCMDWLDDLITTYKLDYLKWDMNRFVTERGVDRGKAVKYIQNLYRIWRSMNERHPNVIFENCASGGGRADFGMVPYADRINRSDNAHPADVMILHEGFSRLFIAKTAGGAGNIALDANVPLQFRIHLGMTGSMSIGIDLLKASEETLAKLAEATAAFKEVRDDLQNSYVYRIASATENPYVVWQYVRRDRKTFAVFGFSHSMRVWEAQQLPRFRMRGLVPDGIYVDAQGVEHTGIELMNIGIELPLTFGDYKSCFLYFKEK